MAILFNIEGVPQAKASLFGSAARMRRPERALRFIGEEMLTRNARTLAAGLDVDGARLKPSRRAERSGGQTMFDTGALAASENYGVNGGNLDLFSTHPSAGVHWRGDTIRPKRAQFLTIPLRAAGGMFAGGVDVRANRRGDRASHYAKASTFFAWRNGRLFLFQKTGKNRLRALFLLVKSVRMPKRKWMGFGARDVEMVREVLARHVLSEGGRDL